MAAMSKESQPWNLIFIILYTHHMANYLGKPFTTGSYDSHVKTEIMSLANGEWQSGPDYPFHSK